MKSMKEKLKKIALVVLRRVICLLDGVNNALFTDLYYRYLKWVGIQFDGKPNYIAASAYLDGQGYDIIRIGKDVVISREAMLLTHDFSIETALHAIGEGTEKRTTHINKGIIIGDNSFIGARASILPGTRIGKNCIIGACSVVKGNVPDNSVVIGNPCKLINDVSNIAKRYRECLSVEFSAKSSR